MHSLRIVRIILLMKADKQNAKMHGKKEDSG